MRSNGDLQQAGEPGQAEEPRLSGETGTAARRRAEAPSMSTVTTAVPGLVFVSPRDPCGLATPEELAAALEQPIQRTGRRQLEHEDGCHFTGATGTNGMVSIIDEAGYAKVREGGEVRPLKGIGDEAFVGTQTPVITGRKGMSHFAVGVLTERGREKDFEAAVVLAVAVAARL